MYAMLAGGPPFRGTAAEVLEQHRDTAPTPLSELRPEVPEPLGELVSQLLAKDPDHRPTGAEVKARLADLAERPTALVIPMAPQIGRSRVVSAPVAATRRKRRTGRLMWFGAVVAGLVATGLLVATNWGTSSESADATGPLPPPATTSPTMTATPPGSGTPSRAAPANPPSASRPSVQPSSQAPPGDPIAALRLAFQQQVSTGNLNPDKASDLYTKVDAIAHSAIAGNVADETHNIKEFQDRLTALRTGGQLSASGYDTLTRALAAVTATLP